MGQNTKESMMPVWLDDSHIDPDWIRSSTNNKLDCTKCSVMDISNERRRAKEARNGATLKLLMTMKDGSKQQTFIAKQVPPQGEDLSIRLGLAREALFYKHLASDLPSIQLTPQIYYSNGDFLGGQKFILMEDLAESVDSGAFFGPGNPNNWNRNLEEMIQRCGPDAVPSVREVALRTFTTIATVHATYWKRPDLLQDSMFWLRGQEWVMSKGRDKWQASQETVRAAWEEFRQIEDVPKNNIRWDPTVRAAVEKAVDGISWEAQTKRLHTEGHWTLVHGDFWPGNVMWMTKGSSSEQKPNEASIRLIDWEMVGLGSGPQDLGQYVISNMEPSERKACELDLVKAYYSELVRGGVKSYSWEECWSEYKIGGVERWLWFLIFFLGNAKMTAWAQFFHDQISSFMKDHNMSAADITQPRP